MSKGTPIASKTVIHCGRVGRSGREKNLCYKFVVLWNDGIAIWVTRDTVRQRPSEQFSPACVKNRGLRR